MKINPPASSSSPTSRKKPRIMRHLISLAPESVVSPYRADTGNSTSSASYQLFRPAPEIPGGTAKALTLQNVASIRAPMAAGAIPPPQFFEQRRDCEPVCSPSVALPGTPEQHHSVDHAFGRPTRSGPAT